MKINLQTLFTDLICYLCVACDSKLIRMSPEVYCALVQMIDFLIELYINES